MTDAAAPRPLRVDARTVALVALLALAVSTPSLANGFAYDDKWIIVTNSRVHSLSRWLEWFTTAYWPAREPSLYRPLTTAAFALQWMVGHGTPLLFHIVNVVLYVAGACAFTWLVSLVLPAAPALAAGALFAVHPVHVEAVANIVGQSELSAGLVLLLAMAIYIRARRAGGPAGRTILAITGLYLVGATLKEHALILPAWLLAAEVTLFRDDGPWRARATKLLPLFACLSLVAALAFYARYRVLGALGGDVPHPALDDLNPLQRVFVMLGVFPDIARVLVWPAKLYADYSPDHVKIFTAPDPTQINGVLIAIGTIVLFAVAWRRNAVAAFGLLIAGLAWLPTSNLLFPSGVLAAERTLFLPSAGVLLAVGTVIAWAQKKRSSSPALPISPSPNLSLAVLGVLLTLGITRFVTRDLAWRSSQHLFWVMRRDEPLSFRAHYAWGAMLFDRRDLRGGEVEWRMAIRIYPNYHAVYTDLAHRYREYHLCGAAIPTYEKAISVGGPLPLALAGLVACQLELARFSDARRTARDAMRQGVDTTWFRARLISADSALAKNDSVR